MKIEFRLDAQGIGDAVCGALTACGFASRGHAVTFYTKHWEWFQWVNQFNLTIRGDDPSVFNANAGYTEQLHAARIGECRSRASWYARNIQALFPYIKGEAKPRLPVELLPTGEGAAPGAVVIAPFSAYADREWSAQHWRLLAKLLIDEGHKVIAIGSHREAERLRETFSKTGVTYHWGQTPEWVVSTIRSSSLLIGNDSGPAHLAGLYGAKAIALCGQSDGDFIYRDTPSVKAIHPPESVKCRKCHWEEDGGWSWICSNSCSALQLISPFDVVEQAVRMIKGESLESIPSEEGGRETGLSGSRIPGIQQTSERTEGERQEEDGPREEGRRGEAGEVRPEGLRGLHAAQGSGTTLKLPRKKRGDSRQERQPNEERSVQPELLGAKGTLVNGDISEHHRPSEG